MITAAFALLSCYGAWMTWRHNPLYSARATLKFLGALVLMIGAAIGIIVLTLRVTDGQSAAVQGGALGVAVIVCTLGLIFGIIATSTPAAAQLTTRLPPNAAVVHLNRARLRPWIKSAIWVLGVCLLLTLIPGPVRFIAAACAAIGAFMAIIMLPVAYVTALHIDRAVTALQLHPWVHWHYAPEVWRDWSARQADVRAQAQAVRMSPAARRWTLVLLPLFAVGYAAYAVPGSAAVRAGSALASGLFVLGLGLMTRLQSRSAPNRIERRLLTAPPDTFFGHDGVLCNGEFCTWRSTEVYLLSASLEAAAPRCIDLQFEKIVPAAYGSTNILHVRQQVLIPADAAATDLSVLQAALVARCPGATITLA